MPHLTPPPQREAVGSTAGRPHLLSGSGEVPLCSTPLRDPPEIRDTLGGALRWLCGQRAPHVGSPNACFELRPLCSGSPSPPPGPAGGVGPSLLLQPRSVGRSAQPKAARHEAAPNAAHCRPPPAAAVPAALIAPSSSPYPPPPSPAVSPRHSPVPVPLPLRAAASHPLCHALSSPSPPNPLRTDAVGSKLNFSITAHLSYPGA